MNTLLHAIAQSLGWGMGAVLGLFSLVFGYTLIKKLTAKPMGGLSRTRQHKLFLAYWRKLEKREQYEDMEDLRPLLIAYQEGRQPTRKELNGYKLVTKTELKAVDTGLRFVTTRRITRKED